MDQDQKIDQEDQKIDQDQKQIYHDVDIGVFYKLSKWLGERRTVRRGRRRDAKEEELDVAIKKVGTSEMTDEEKRALNEQIRLNFHLCKHPNFEKIYEVYFENQKRKRVHLVMELLEGGKMLDRIGERGFFSEDLAAFSIAQILNALEYCHGWGICHRNIKPHNLSYVTKSKDSRLVIGGFGLATRSKLMRKMCGTPGYVAPEILSGKPYDCKVDCWSVGVVLYLILCGYPPFYADSDDALFIKIRTKPVEFNLEHWGRISDEAKDLISKLLVKDPDKRLTASEAKEHPWFPKALGKVDQPLGKEYQDRMRRFIAVQRLRAGVTTMLAMKKMARIMNEIIQEDEEEMKSAVVANDEEDIKSAVVANAVVFEDDHK